MYNRLVKKHILLNMPHIYHHKILVLTPTDPHWTYPKHGVSHPATNAPKTAWRAGAHAGVVRLQVWPGVSQLDLGSADLRIFSSPDAMAIGKQVAGGGGRGPVAGPQRVEREIHQETSEKNRDIQDLAVLAELGMSDFFSKYLGKMKDVHIMKSGSKDW